MTDMGDMKDEAISNATDEFLSQQDNADQVEGNIDAYDEAPYQKKGDSLFNLFEKVWKANDSSKVANLNLPELGRLGISVREAQYMALLATTLKHENFANFFLRHAEIILSTSASKKGWFTELFISQKKYTQRTAANVQPVTPQKKSWSIMGNKNPQAESQA